MEALKRSVAEAQAANGVKVTDVEKKAAKAGLKQASSAKPAKGVSAKGAAAKKKKVG
jgi:hypothetical protein